MSKSPFISITMSLAVALAAGCVDPQEPEAVATASVDQGAARFLADALDGRGAAASYTYEVATPDDDADPTARVRTIGVSSEVAIPPELTVASETGFTWCTAASPTVSVSKTIWCTSCNKNDAEDCARQWANSTAIDACETQISLAGGDAACAPAMFTDDICVRDTSSGLLSNVQFGDDTACGTWPFRHAKWKATYRVAGDCGYRCRD